MPQHLAQGSEFPPLDPEKLRFYDMVFCPYGRRVKLVLEYHKFDYEQVYINLANKPDWFTSRFPTGKVPAIEQNGEKMVESEMICLFLDQMHPEDSLFNASGQEKIDAVKAWWDKMIPNVRSVIRETDIHEDKKQAFFDCIKEFEDLIKDTYISGAKVGLADFLVFPLLDRMEACYRVLDIPPPTESDRPRLTAWLSAMRSLPAVANHQIDTDRYYKFALSQKSGSPDYEI